MVTLVLLHTEPPTPFPKLPEKRVPLSLTGVNIRVVLGNLKRESNFGSAVFPTGSLT